MNGVEILTRVPRRHGKRHWRMKESKQNISWEKEGHNLCDFGFSSSFQKIDMILLTRPEGGLIGLIILIYGISSMIYGIAHEPRC